ncbi:MAG: 4-hydroxythreonine-4-phosphate dehydrogenase PdxA [Hyphomonadaceae bacterium]|nr:4-hydroxythreonine-4-phosphate dehydrogenase PdxA [Hyphomonadaceae bacterium]
MRPLAVTMGDPAGIGLELAARVWAERTADTPPFVFIGDPDALLRAARRVRLPEPKLALATRREEIAAVTDSTRLTVVPLSLELEETPGEPESLNAKTVVDAIDAGIQMALGGVVSALVTLPIAKSILQSTGPDIGFSGHTEFIAYRTLETEWSRTRGPVMMLAGPSLKVALATIHTPLARVASQITQERIVQVGRVVGEALQHDFGIATPRIALCGLNPHAGEGGLIGREEVEIINPAAAQLRAEGWTVSDASSADALFHGGARQHYDAAIALYHDQGLIPIKTLHFWDAVNVTLGLPIVRTSPDHGTGFDIAGKGLARPDSFRAALKLAWEMAKRRAAS